MQTRRIHVLVEREWTYLGSGQNGGRTKRHVGRNEWRDGQINGSREGRKSHCRWLKLENKNGYRKGIIYELERWV